MMDPAEAVFIALIVVGLPIMLMMIIANRFFKFREKQLDVDAALAAEKAAQYAASNAELEQRLRVVEQIVTDGGAQTAAQIEALRQQPLSAPKTRDKSPQESLD